MGADAHQARGDGGDDDRRGQPREPAPDHSSQEHASSELLDAIRQLGATGRAGLGAAGDATKAMRSLVAADMSLAGNALARAAAYIAMAALLGGTGWLLLMATLIVFLSRPLGIPWSLSLLVTAVLSGLLAAFGVWRALRYLQHARMQATRRQLARLDIGELAGLVSEHSRSPGAASEVAHPHPQDAS